ncbi:MAG: NADH-quinone oxidoreductase subunit C [Euryarchaeota archaeon]|nr:NADH-quinone oxidoreductase subunit C [Euryarchaeota archaeon]MDE1837602.1 NADH-quinone oxidoreductase subunit C [Euryarchaeota archaeon]MDE1881255.1 NADH-quinone oxidoreductase subunit C [Euryarchaeota archaeon]MDE2045913.1 NADH-quinone oxidoreductase subunit C [Thermoplasmata archaeon]
MKEIPYEGDEASVAAVALPAIRPVPTAADEGKWARNLGLKDPTGEAARGPWTGEVPRGSWRSVALSLRPVLQHRLATLWGEDARDRVRVHALWLGGSGTRGVHLYASLPEGSLELPTLSPEVAPALYFEREVAEMFGVEFAGSPDTRPLLLHHRHRAPPMRGEGAAPEADRSRFDFAPVEGEGVYEIPVGPVHAGVIEPGHFRFQALGEQILDLEVRLGYTHKGTERLWQGRDPQKGVLLAESISGDHSVAGAVAYASAVEGALETPSLPAPVEAARGLLLETERIAFLLGDVSGIVLDVGYAAGAAQANVLRDRAYRLLESLTGSRLGRGTVRVGGLSRPLPTLVPGKIARELQELARGTEELLDHVQGVSSIMDRLRGTGTVPLAVADALGMVGPAARASGADRDVRRDRPYGAYRNEEVRVARQDAGDVEARLRVKVEEVREASRLAQAFLKRGALGGAVSVDGGVPSVSGERFGLGIVESPRGEFLFAVSIDHGSLQRVHVREPSFLNWPAIEYAVRENIVPDFPLCNKSLNLSYSGFDR